MEKISVPSKFLWIAIHDVFAMNATTPPTRTLDVPRAFMAPLILDEATKSALQEEIWSNLEAAIKIPLARREKNAKYVSHQVANFSSYVVHCVYAQKAKGEPSTLSRPEPMRVI